ncbi:MAG: PIN domain-containing protein [Acidobacteria bacterium]|nr:PIN domain-containing protein [Acidobacteriota bacterium]
MTPLRCVVDTNVLVTAAGANDAASAACAAASVQVLRDLIAHGHVFIDDGGRIVEEYRRGIDLGGKSDAGEEFLKWLITNEFNVARVTRVALTPKPDDPQDFAELPALPAGLAYDPADRKFIAVAAAHDDHPPVLQTLDSKWWGWRDALAAAGVIIHFLCPAEIARKFHEKMD